MSIFVPVRWTPTWVTVDSGLKEREKKKKGRWVCGDAEVAESYGWCWCVVTPVQERRLNKGMSVSNAQLGHEVWDQLWPVGQCCVGFKPCASFRLPRWWIRLHNRVRLDNRNEWFCSLAVVGSIVEGEKKEQVRTHSCCGCVWRWSVVLVVVSTSIISAGGQHR